MYRRPIVGIAIALILGIIVQSYLRLPIKIIWLIILANLTLMILLTYLKKNGKAIIILLIILFIGGLHLEYNYRTEDSLKYFVGKKVELVGDCAQKYVTDKSVYVFNIRNIMYRGKSYKTRNKTLLKVFDYEGVSLNNKRVIINSRLKIPDSARNPKMFDYNLYLKTQDIHTILNTNGQNIEIIDSGNLSFLIKLRHEIKSQIYNKTLEILPDNEGEIALSIAFGDKKIIDENLYETFKVSGTAHVLAVSGLHFGILFIFIDTILRRFKMKEKHKSLMLILLIWIFAFIVGFSPSVIRASSMITLCSISNLFDRKYDLFTSLALISLINVIINPFIIFNVGFQLSFFAVLSIGLFYKPIYERLAFLPDFLRKMVSTTLSAQIGTAPIIAYHFNNFSLIALIINIPVVLLITYILPVSLIFFISLFVNASIAKYIAFLDEILIKLLIRINSISSYLPFSSMNVVSPSLLYIAFFFIGIILVFYKNRIPYISKYDRRKLLLIFLSIIITINGLKLMYPKKLKLTFVDVGQGDCILIETPKGKNILIDGGEYKKDFLSKFLLRNHISYIDLICISHIHNDHIGGIIEVMENINFGSVVIGTKIYSSEEYKELINKCNVKDVSIMEFSRGKTIAIEEDITLTAVHPPAKTMSNTRDDINNNSLVIILKHKDIKVLLTGDIEKEAEMEIIKEASKTDIDIIKVGHHGSYTSSSEDFIEHFDPEIAVIQVGKNVFGHPHRDTLETLKKREIKIYRNDKNGAVIIESDGENIEVNAMLE